MRRDPAVLAALVLALAVDRHRGRDDEPRGPRLTRDKTLEEDCGGIGVVPYVPLDLVHRLPDADERSEMHDAIHAFERVVDDRRVGEVPVEKPHFLRNGNLVDTLVNLSLEAVEHDHVVSARDELAHEVRADEPSSSGDERLHLHTTS